MILVTKSIFVPIFFAALFEEKLNKLLDQLNISRITGIRPNRISGRAIWYPAGYRISKRLDYLEGYPVHPLLLTQFCPLLHVQYILNTINK
jgi:hypothetical protein